MISVNKKKKKIVNIDTKLKSELPWIRFKYILFLIFVHFFARKKNEYQINLDLLESLISILELIFSLTNVENQ